MWKSRNSRIILQVLASMFYCKMQIKVCTKCKIELLLAYFTKQKRGLFGVRSNCKKCINEYMRSYHKKRNVLDPEFKKKKNCRAMLWAKNNPEKRAKIAKARNEKAKLKNPEKISCRQLINQKVRFGRIPKASDLKCFSCENQAKHYHHHKGYSFENRYDVIPLCTQCHKN